MLTLIVWDRRRVHQNAIAAADLVDLRGVAQCLGAALLEALYLPLLSVPQKAQLDPFACC